MEDVVPKEFVEHMDEQLQITIHDLEQDLERYVPTLEASYSMVDKYSFLLGYLVGTLEENFVKYFKNHYRREEIFEDEFFVIRRTVAKYKDKILQIIDSYYRSKTEGTE